MMHIVNIDLNKFMFNVLCSLQLRLDHLDELGRPILHLNAAETSFLNELQGETKRLGGVKTAPPTDGTIVMLHQKHTGSVLCYILYHICDCHKKSSVHQNKKKF